MPEMQFDIVWPDGTPERCYSPSLVIKDFFVLGKSYALEQFLHLSRAALTEASDRVEKKYGMPCARALAQLSRIEAGCARFSGDVAARVLVTRFHE